MKIRMIVAALGGLFAVGTAQAGDFYLGAGVQTTQLGYSSASSETGWRVHAGYTLTPRFAIETAYLDAGSRVSASTSALSGVMLFPAGQAVTFFGKAGLHNTKTEVSLSAMGQTFRSSTTDTSLALGAGMLYTFDRFAWRIDYDWFDVDYGSNKSIGFSGQYRF